MKFNFEATGVGSVPFKDPKIACEKILSVFKDIPFWPQLPKRSFLENMYVQYAEGFPGIVIDEKGRSIYVDTDRAEREIEPFYEQVIGRDVGKFAISRKRAEGLYVFLETAKAGGKQFPFIKGHITGPVSFALSITDIKKRSIIYDVELFECVVKLLSMKIAWQIEMLKTVSPNIIIFIDEPQLVSIGSGYINIDAGKAKEKLEEIIDIIKTEGVLCGIHCCGNTDWQFLLSRPIDIINFDAYNFIDQFVLFDADIDRFLKRGGAVAWGIVPTSDGEGATKDGLIRRIERGIDKLVKKGIDRERISSLITPSCGVGTLEEKKAENILALTKEISGAFRK